MLIVLCGAGGKNFLISDVYDQSQGPLGQTLAQSIPTAATLLYNYSLQYHDAIKSLGASEKVHVVSAFDAFKRYQTFPLLYKFDPGHLRTVCFQPAVAATATTPAIPRSICKNPNGSVFWDTQHVRKNDAFL